MPSLGIHIFRRDLRLEDNTALNALFEEVDTVLPVFIFDTRQTNEHPYKSEPGLQILTESLADLDAALRERGSMLHVREGVAEEVVADLIKEYAPIALSYNKDYTPFARARDEALNALLTNVIAKDDATLHAPGTITTKEGKPYSVYTRYRIAVESQKIPVPVRLKKEATFIRAEGIDLKEITRRLVPNPRTLLITGGRTAAKKQLTFLDTAKGYTRERDIPSVHGTSRLSAHIKFGTLSLREIYHYAKLHMPSPETFLKELLWHDFFTTVAALSPHVYEGAYRKEFNAITWSDDQASFERWKEGMTGFPIVDAGMRELKATGYMHNRVRMIVASFLVKDLHINWQWGERYFAQTLGDYDPAVNNGNWQWVAGTGCDAAPWFRIFNPWLQQKKFDPDAIYILKWIPELQGLSVKDIHDEVGLLRQGRGYPSPLCDHAAEAKKTKELYRAATAQTSSD